MKVPAEGPEAVALGEQAVAPGVEALEEPGVAEAEEEVAVLEVIRNNYFEPWFNNLNLKCKSIHH